MTTHEPLPGFGSNRAKASRGPVYQGVCAQIRRLTRPVDGGEPLIDEQLWKGTIAQARALAASIDRVDGSDGTGQQANGVPLAAMHERLDALLARLNPEAQDDSNPMQALVAAFQREEAEVRAAAAAQAPHAPE
ncbi:MAG: hypothetical protein IE926_05760 [Micrococcales bacterium]|nr:hypothetical protein [Micrococcales bacterium]